MEVNEKRLQEYIEGNLTKFDEILGKITQGSFVTKEERIQNIIDYLQGKDYDEKENSY